MKPLVMALGLFVFWGAIFGAAHAQSVLSLQGDWAFRLDPESKGVQEEWQKQSLPGVIHLPGSTDQAGVGTENTERRVAYLSRLWEYTGPAWYQREVVIPEAWAGMRVSLFLERCHWETRVWVDGKEAGSQDSLCTPHVYDFSANLDPGPHRISICVNNAIKYNVGKNAHSITEHTETNWNGMVGRIELRAQPPVNIQSLQTFPDVKNRRVRVAATILNTAESPAKGRLQCAIKEKGSEAAGIDAEAPLEIEAGQQKMLELEISLGDAMKLWDEFSPVMYELTAVTEAHLGGKSWTDTRTTTLGMREVGQVGTQVAINGRPVMIRGNLECCIFPMTGYPATDLAAWQRLYTIARSYGLNHFRFHSWCPPEAAFDAADQAGFTLHVETPVWTELGGDPKTDAFIHAEADRILETYGNHPSFCMMAVGNEPSGPKKNEFLTDIVSEWKAKDPRRLYTTCSGWPELPVSNYHVVHQRNDKPYRLHSGPLRPDTQLDYRDVLEGCSVPAIAHELGQWCVYPSYEEIPKYTGVLRARNLETFRESLDAHHMLDQAKAFSQASGALQTLMYKADIEAVLRTPGAGGFQLLQLQDFPGQGSALMGFLDAFWDSKGYCTPEQFREFCSETVPLLRMDKFIWSSADTYTASAEISHFGPAPLKQAVPAWVITSNGREVASGKLPALDIPLGNGIALGGISWDLSKAQAPAQYTITLSLEGTPFRNHWDFWVYPAVLEPSTHENVLIAAEWDENLVQALDNGRNVLFLPAYLPRKASALSAFEPIFWNMQWFPAQRRQLGILCDPSHPAFAQFPTNSYTNWQWWDLLNKSRAMVLDGFPAEFRPVVQVIDDWNTNRRLGFLFEARVSKGKLMVCSLDLEHDLDSRWAARQFRYSLMQYMNGEKFQPAVTLEAAVVAGLFQRPSVEVIKVDSEAAAYEGVNAVDGNPATIWHTPWETMATKFPHEIQLRMKEVSDIVGLVYLPRQDIHNGLIAQYEVYVSDDGQAWGRPVAKGKFGEQFEEQTIQFAKPVQGRYIRFVAVSGRSAEPFAAVAELTVLTGARK